jgi:hypothetical protein
MTALGKYHSRKVRFDGLNFDSQAEADRWAELRLLERAGEIESLRAHPRWVLQPAFTGQNGRLVGPHQPSHARSATSNIGPTTATATP